MHVYLAENCLAVTT